MKIIIDIREQSLFDIFLSKFAENANNNNIQILKQVLPLGDILFVSDDDIPICIIERKTLQDLLASIKDGRYKEQSYRLSNSTEYHKHNIFYLVEGIMSTLRTLQEKTTIYSAMTSLQLFKGFSFIRSSSQNETVDLLINMADRIQRGLKNGETFAYSNTMKIDSSISNEMTENVIIEPNTSNENITNYCNVVKKVKKENITPENIGEIILCQIPGISSVTAIAIMQKFTNFNDLMNELKINPDCLNNFTVETNGKIRKINKTSIENIKKYLLGLSPLKI
jgi:ERCC4-type nuclease